MLARFLRQAEAATLLLAGSFMLGLSLSAHYWRLLNPKFMPLTLASGCLLLLIGLVHPFGPGRARWSSLAAMLGFLVLAGLALGPAVREAARPPQASPAFDPGPPPARGSMFQDHPAEAEPSRLVHAGREYVKLNTVELWMLADQSGAARPERVALRGQAFPLPPREGAERFALVRVSVVCCLADAVATGFVVAGPVPEGVRPGGWVAVLGTLAPLTGRAPGLGEVRTPGVTMTTVHETRMLVPDEAAPTPAPEIPFIFEFRDSEPFSW